MTKYRHQNQVNSDSITKSMNSNSKNVSDISLWSCKKRILSNNLQYVAEEMLGFPSTSKVQHLLLNQSKISISAMWVVHPEEFSDDVTSSAIKFAIVAFRVWDSLPPLLHDIIGMPMTGHCLGWIDI